VGIDECKATKEQLRLEIEKQNSRQEEQKRVCLSVCLLSVSLPVCLCLFACLFLWLALAHSRSFLLSHSLSSSLPLSHQYKAEIDSLLGAVLACTAELKNIANKNPLNKIISRLFSPFSCSLSLFLYVCPVYLLS
jgi:hypothetical protein